MIGICCLYSLKKSLTELAVEKTGYPMLYDLIEVCQLYTCLLTVSCCSTFILTTCTVTKTASFMLTCASFEYRVMQNKRNCLLLFFSILYFYNKTHKYDNVHVAPRILVKAVSSTGCNNNRLQNCPILRLIRSWPICWGLLSGAQCLRCYHTTTVDKLLECWPDRIVHWVYKGRSKSSRPDLVLFRIKLKCYLLLIVARFRTRHAQYDFWAINILCILAKDHSVCHGCREC